MFFPAQRSARLLARPDSLRPVLHCRPPVLSSIPGVFAQPVHHDRNRHHLPVCDLPTIFRLSFIESLLLTTFFFTSQNVINGSVGVWSQRASVFLVPPILLLALVSFHHRPGRRRLLLAGLSGFLALLLFPQDFYSGYFTFFFAFLFLVAWAFVEGHVAAWLPGINWRTQPLAEKLALVVTLIGAAWTTYLWESGGVRMRVLGIRIASQDWRRPAVVTLLCAVVFGWLRGAQRIRADVKRAPAQEPRVDWTVARDLRAGSLPRRCRVSLDLSAGLS